MRYVVADALDGTPSSSDEDVLAALGDLTAVLTEVAERASADIAEAMASISRQVDDAATEITAVIHDAATKIGPVLDRWERLPYHRRRRITLLARFLRNTKVPSEQWLRFLPPGTLQLASVDGDEVLDGDVLPADLAQLLIVLSVLAAELMGRLAALRRKLWPPGSADDPATLATTLVDAANAPSLGRLTASPTGTR